MASSIGQRPLDDTERKALRRWFPPLVRNLPGTIFRYGLMVVLVFLTLAVAGVMIDMLIRDLWHGPPLQSPLWVDVALVVVIYGITLFAPLPRVLRSHRRRMRRDQALRDDLSGDVAQVIELHATDAALVWLEEQAVICLDLSPDQRLLVHCGRLRWDKIQFERIVAEEPDTEEEEEDGMHDQDDDTIGAAWSRVFAFPSRHCVIHRLPHSGCLQRIDQHGSPIEPFLVEIPDHALADALKRLSANPDIESMLIPGIAPQSNPS